MAFKKEDKIVEIDGRLIGVNLNTGKLTILEDKKEKKDRKKKKGEKEVAIPVFKRGFNDARTIFMIEKLMKEQPNLSKEEAIIKYFKGVGKDPILKKLQIDRKMSLGGAVNNTRTVARKKPKGAGAALRGYGALLKG